MKQEYLQHIEEFLMNNDIDFDKNRSLKSYTWIQRGGVVQFWIKPDSIEKIKSIVSYLYKTQINFYVVGATSNLYFQNDYHPEVVISTLRINKIAINKDYVVAECGALSSKLSVECIKNNIEGFEGFTTIPGTIGGAVCNNSSCFNSCIDELVDHIEVITKNGCINLNKNDLNYKRRSSIFKRKEIEGVILRVFLKKQIALNPELLIKNTEKFKYYRKKYQEKPQHNLGSVFAEIELKNTLQIMIWKMFKKLLKIIHIKKDKQLKLNKQLFFIIHGKFKMSYYVSDFSFNCFVWKDHKADVMFFKYKSFIERISKKAELEIEIVDRNYFKQYK